MVDQKHPLAVPPAAVNLGKLAVKPGDDGRLIVSPTTAARRQHFAYRLAAPATDVPSLVSELSKFSSGERTNILSVGSGEKAKVAMMFTGQGSQYQNMGKGLYAN